MKIVYCVPALYNPGGMERVLTEKVNYLVRKTEFEITIITTEQQNRTPYFALDNLVKKVDFALDFDAHFDENPGKKIYSHYKKLRRYKHLLRDFLLTHQIDICISLGGKEIEFLSTLPVPCVKIAEIHFSLHHRQLFLLARHKGWIWKQIGAFRTWQLKRATRNLKYLVVLTEQDAREWRLTHHNIRVIPNPAPFECDLPYDKSSKVIISVGKLDEQKGYDYLLEAWKTLSADYPDWTLKIFGQGPWLNKLNSFIIRYGMGKSVQLCGVTDRIKEEYAHSAFYVMTSRYEGLPMVLIEALTCGLPLVSFDCEWGPRDVIEENKNGVLVPMGDIEALIKQMKRLMDCMQMRVSMSGHAKKMAIAYRRETILSRWIDLFHEAVSRCEKGCQK